MKELVLPLYETGGATRTISIRLFGVDGSNNPTGSALASDSFTQAFTTTASFYTIPTTLGGFNMVSGQTYALVISSNAPSTSMSWTGRSSVTVAYPIYTAASGWSFVQTTRTTNSGSSWSSNTYQHGMRMTVSPVVNGSCGSSHSTSLVTSAPSTNLCTAGTAGSVTDSSSAYTWSCAGSGGGTTDSCSASRGYTVTPSAGSNGNISPNTAQVLAFSATPAFAATPATGYAVNSWGGSCGGTPSGTGNVNYSTTGVSADCTVQVSFLLAVASQTITFSNPGSQSFGTTPTLTASSSAGGGYPVTFTSATTGVCTITTGGVLAFVTTGNCTINADQAGDGSTLAAPQVSQTFTVNAVAPGVPTAVVASAGNSQATVSWTAPASNGGAAIIGYRVQIATTSGGTYADAAGTCAFATTGTSTAVTCTATGLTNGTQYFFKVAAVSSAGTGSYSTASSGVTPVAPVINGACGTSGNVTTAFLPTANLCSTGTASNVTPGTSSWAWSCTGTGPSATNATCSAPYPVVNGGGGTVGAIQMQSTNSWQIDQAASGFVALPAAAPAGVTLPGGATKVVLITGTAGTSATVTLRFSSIPAGAQLYKYGKENGIGDSNTWFAYPATIDVGAGTVTYTLTDGQRGDNDWTANSVIDDPVGLGVGGGAVASIPTLSEWGVIILSTLMALFGLVWMRRRQV